MWTLVLYTMLVATASGAGTSSTTTTIRFDTETQCRTATERLLTVPSHAIFDGQNKQVGVFRIFAQCIADAK